MLERAKYDERADDQTLLSRYCDDNATGVYVDRSKTFFLTIHHLLASIIPEEDDIVIRRRRLYFRPGRRQPFFLHANGNTDMDAVLVALEYPLSAAQRHDLRSVPSSTTAPVTTTTDSREMDQI